MKPGKAIGAGLLVIVGVLGLITWVARVYRAPLGPALQAPPTTISPTAQSVSTLAPATVQAKECGETGAWNVLILGSDAGDLRGTRGSDLTRMLRVDFSNQKVTSYSFPRDLWVDTSGLGLTNPTIDATRLGMVLYEARSRSTKTDFRETMRDGTNATALMLAKNFAIGTDHYLAIDLAQIPAMVDAIGGVPINIPQETTDPWIGMVISAGQQTLSGEEFVAYARAIPDSDYARIQRNNLLLDALRTKLLDPELWVMIPGLYSQFHEVITTDLSPEQINHLACLMKALPAEGVAQDGLREEWTSAGPEEGSLLWDKLDVTNQMKELGLIP